MKILLTGASSFIGSHMAAHLVRRGFQVTGTYRTANAKIDSLRETSGLDLVKLDLRRVSDVSRLPPDIESIVHVAAASTIENGDIDAMIDSNVDGTQNLLRYALDGNARSLIYMSSLSVHGQVTSPVVDEHTPSQSPGLYGATKFLGERMIAEVGDRLPSVAIRLPGVLGKGAHRAWLPGVVSRAQSGQAVTVYNPHGAFNNAVHVRDLSRFVEQLLQMQWIGFRAFPIGAGDTMEVGALVRFLLHKICCEVPVDVTESAQSGFVISSERARRDFGYQPQSLRDILGRYAEDLSD